MAQIWTQSVGWGSRRAAGLRGPALPLIVLLMVLLVIPVLVLAATAILVIAGVRGTRALVSRMRSPNGVLDGRRNVRVIVRE